MRLSGVTPITGTSALVAAINYDHKLPIPNVRLDSCGNDQDFDEIIVLGGNGDEIDRSFHVLAQIHSPGKTSPMTQVPQNTFLKVQPCGLKEVTDPPSFAAYINSMNHED